METNYREYELSPVGSRQKSFYGKAEITDSQGRRYLRSYATTVCRTENGRFIRMWGGYSATTMKHINAFRIFCELPPMGKSEWAKLEVER